MMDNDIPFGLSPREKKLLRRFASGMTDKQIAQELRESRRSGSGSGKNFKSKPTSSS
jgi:FixJ family two-component response regulator